MNKDSITILATRDQIAVTDSELRAIGKEHIAKTDIYDGEFEKWIPIANPICAFCGEPWGTWGCSTIRLITLVAIEKRDRAVAEENARKLTRTLAEIASRGGINKIPSERTLKLWCEIHDIAIVQAPNPMDVVDAVLEKMRRGAAAEIEKMPNKRIILPARR